MDEVIKSEKKVRLRLGNYKTTFTNTAIDSLSLKGQLDKGQYIKVMFKNQRGIWLYWSPIKKKKKFKYRFRFERKDYDLDLGEYIKGFYGCEEVLSKLSDIYKKYKEHGKWKSNPKEELLTNSELVDSQKLTIRKVIEKLCEYNFPRKDIEGKLASITAHQFSLFLIGHNKRRDHLDFKDDEEGMCTITFKNGVKSWEELWNKYPSGRGNKSNKEVSVYDSKLGSSLIDDLTPGMVERYLEERQRSYGYKKNVLKALQSMWGFARGTLKAFGDKRPTDPTSMKEGGVEIKRPNKSKFLGSKYNDVSLEGDQKIKVMEKLEELKEDKGYRVLAIELLTHSRFRISETLKLKKTDIHDDYILFRKQTSKMRSKGIKSKDVKVPITPIIQTIINDIKETDKKYPHLQFVPWLFPSPRINLEKLNDQPGYAQKPECRLKDISETFDIIRKDLGLDISLKTLRKTFITEEVEAQRDLGKTEAEAIEDVAKNVTGHEGKGETIKHHYYKPSFKKELKRAKDTAKVMAFKTKN